MYKQEERPPLAGIQTGGLLIPVKLQYGEACAWVSMFMFLLNEAACHAEPQQNRTEGPLRVHIAC